MARDQPTLFYPVASLGRGRIGASLALGPQQRRQASEPATGAKSDEEYGHCLIKPDPGCPECTEIMLWRSSHRLITITDEAEIRLSYARCGSRHLRRHEVEVAHLKKQRQRKERERKEQ